MLTRIRGGSEGIAKYLRDGKKEGREHTRDELDERLVLAGDLDLTDAIIASIDGTGERYKHITLAFKEDEISHETLAQIVEDFRSFAFSAYHQDEYNFYAEAHLPRIKSYEHRETSKTIERKPHIHFLVPKTNLLTGKALDPFGFFNFSERHLFSFQQHLNDKYGLADPRNHPRIEFTDASEMISRYKGDVFKGANKDFKSRLLDTLLERDIASYEDFKTMLGEFGTVIVRNAGTPKEYLNVTPFDEKKGINLNHHAFKSDFVSLSKEEKHKALTLENEKHYEAAGPSRHSPEQCIAMLKEWREYRAKEVKYINSGNKKFYAQYKAMSREEKIALLNEREAAFYAKYLGAEYDGHTSEKGSDARTAAFERIGNNLRSSSDNLAAASGFAGDLDQAAGNLADRTALRAIAAVINGRGRDQAESRASTELATEGNTSSVVGRYQRELSERNATAKATKQSEFAEIKQNLEAGRLLAYLSKSHGVIVEKYEVTRGNDGNERIKCGNRNLNVSDFLTKEMNLPWKDAAKILREAYAAQRQQVHYQAKKTPSRELWAKFQEWKKADVPAMRNEALQKIRADHREAIAKASKEFNAQRSKIEGNKTLKKAEAKLYIDIAKAEREHAKKLARDSRNAVFRAEREKWSTKGDNLYKRFLAEAAQSNEAYAETALTELRKRAPDVAAKEDAASYIKSADLQAIEQSAAIKRDLKYTVDIKGHVTYKLDGKEAFKDEGQRVSILRANDNDVIEQSLYLAKAKFGKTITVNGTDEFKARAVEIAVEKNIPVEFSDPNLQRMKHELMQQREQRKRLAEQGRRAITIEKERKEKEKADALLKEKEAAKDKASKKAEEPAKQAKAEEVLAVPGSILPYKKHGTYKGEVLAVDNSYVYQQTEQGVIHHARNQFKELPREGDNIAIRYDAGKVTRFKEIERDQSHER